MRGRLALAVLAVPLLAAACGGGGGGSSTAAQQTTATVQLTPLASVRESAKKTAAATSEHMAIDGSLSLVGQSVTLSGSGDFDNASKAGTLHMEFALGGMNGAIDEVMTGTTIYMKSSLFASAMPQGKTWMKLDLQKALASKGVDLSSLLSQTPSNSLAQLEAIGNVRKVGDETVGGVVTAHYRGRVDLSKLPKGVTAQGLTSAKLQPYDIWVGKADGYVHRVRIGFAAAPAGMKASMSMTMDFSDFGKTVTVKAPPAAETFDATNASIQGLTGG